MVPNVSLIVRFLHFPLQSCPEVKSVLQKEEASTVHFCRRVASVCHQLQRHPAALPAPGPALSAAGGQQGEGHPRPGQGRHGRRLRPPRARAAGFYVRGKKKIRAPVYLFFKKKEGNRETK